MAPTANMMLLAAFVVVAAATEIKTSRQDADMNPVTKVVKLLEEMQEKVGVEAKEDEKMHDKMRCWCETNEKEKTAAIQWAKEHIEELNAFIEESSASVTQLTGEVEALNVVIAEGQKALDTATGIRQEDEAAFTTEEADMKETLGMLREAVAVLSKVNLAQKTASAPLPAAAMESLAQVRRVVSRFTSRISAHRSENLGIGGAYKSVMQRDLWDMLGSLPGAAEASPAAYASAALDQQPTGAAAGAKSYNGRSGAIFGVLDTMRETFTKNLVHAQKTELMDSVAYQKLRAAKEAELDSARKSVEEKTARIADLNEKIATAIEDRQDTTEQLAADEKFLADMLVRCKKAEEEYDIRQKTRADEQTAISQTIEVLSEDSMRDLFAKTVSLLQVSSSTSRTQALMKATTRSALRARAAAKLFALARARGASSAWQLATLAASVQLDDFEKVKEMMDKLIADLKSQQTEELEKFDGCNADIAENEGAIRKKGAEKKDVEARLEGHEGAIANLKQAIEESKADLAAAHVALQDAGLNRKEENQEFQQVVADQRATQTVLKTALERLTDFYLNELQTKSGKSFLQKGRQDPPPQTYQQSGAAGEGYAKSGGAAGVMEMLKKLIQDAEKADQEAVAAESEAQAAYEELLTNSNAMIDAQEKSISQKEEAKANEETGKRRATTDLESTNAELEDLDKASTALHLDCDYLRKNFDIRQQGRRDEWQAIQEAKGILSGSSQAR